MKKSQSNVPPYSGRAGIDIVGLCQDTEPQIACDKTDPIRPKPIFFVGIIDLVGNLIPTDSTDYPAPDAFVGDGSGYVRSYYADAGGKPIDPQPLPENVTLGSCDSAETTLTSVALPSRCYAVEGVPAEIIPIVNLAAGQPVSTVFVDSSGKPVEINDNDFLPMAECCC